MMSMRVEAEVSKGRGLAWTLGATGLSAAILVVGALQSALSASTVVAMVALVTTLSFLALTRDAPRRRGSKRRVGADGRGLSVDGELVVPREALIRARVRDEPDGSHSVTVDTRGLFPSHVVRVGSARIAQALADTLEQTPHRIAEFDALPPWAHRMRWLAVVLTTSPWILFSLLRHMPSFMIMLVLALYGLIGLPLVVPQKVAIGEDGVLLRWAGRRRFLPFGRLRAARSTALGVELDLADDRTIEIRLTHRSEGEASQRTAMLQQIEEGIAIHRALGPAEDEALLLRGERPIDVWIAEMSALGAADAFGYRTIAIPRERLWAVLENPTADPSARQGAALALRERLDDEERERLMVVGQKSASPHLRVAIEAVTSTPDAPRLRVALEEAAEQDAIDEARSAARR
jgi:hypothetical protein